MPSEREGSSGYPSQHQDLSIAVVGDYQARHETHPATSASIHHAADAQGWTADVTWIPTPELEGVTAADLSDYDGVWIAPMSPYRSLRGVLDAIEVARVGDIPLLGTCAGFQHIVLEFARNVLGFVDAQSAEYDPSASRLFISALTCSLAGQTMTVRLRSGTRASVAYGTETATERYYCNFGLNGDYLSELEDCGLVVSGVDQDDEPRIIELPRHRFFVGTLFVPQVSSSPERPHPIIRAFVQAAALPGRTSSELLESRPQLRGPIELRTDTGSGST